MRIKYFRNIKTREHYKWTVKGDMLIKEDILNKKTYPYKYCYIEDAEKAFDLLDGIEAVPIYINE